MDMPLLLGRPPDHLARFDLIAFRDDRIDVSVPEVAEPDDALLPRPEAAERLPDPAPLDRVHAMRTARRSARFGPVVADRDVDAVVISEP